MTPLIIGDLIEVADPYFELILMLNRIMDIVFAPNINPINKFHHLIHYPAVIRENGPPVRYWCMRYEAYHNICKRVAHNNFPKWVKFKGREYRTGSVILIKPSFKTDSGYPEFGLVREDIDGECLLSLTEKQIDGLNLSIGHSIKLQKLVKNLVVESASAIFRKSVNHSGICANDSVMDFEERNDDLIFVIGKLTEVAADPLSNSEEKFPVISILKESTDGRQIVKSFMDRNEAYLEIEERKTLVRILVSHMCMLSGKEDFYPPSSLKEELAKAIVTAFPCLAVPCHEGSSLTNYTHYYNPKLTNGFIDTRLKTMRTKSEPKSNRRPDDELTAEREDPTFNEDEDKFKIEWMKIHLSEPGQWTTTQILLEYPRFRDCHNLIFRDFLLAFPKAGHFEETFVWGYGPLIKKCAGRSNTPIPDTDDECLQLLVLLLRLIPSLKKIRVVSQKSITERVVYFIKANDDILSIIEEKPHLKESPFLCCVGSLKNPVGFNIVCEGAVISSGTSSITAFKNLYASFHMLRIKYPHLLSTFYYFFDSYVFNVHSGGLCSPKECDKGNVPSSDDDPPSDDDEEHGQSLTKYLKRNKRMPLSADTSSDGSDLLEMEGITPSLPLSVGGFYTSTQKEPGLPSPVKVNTPLQSEDESNSGTLNQSANGESQSYQDAGRNRPKNSYFNQAPIVNHVSRRVSVEKPSSDGNRSHGQIDSALLGGNSFRRAPVEHSPAIGRRVRENSIPLGQPDGKRQNAEPVASGSRYREDSWDQVLPGCSTNKHTPAPSANGNRSRPIHKASHGRRSTENSTNIERTASKGHHHQPTPDANSNRQTPSKQPATSGNSHTPKVNVNTASPRYPGVLVTAKQPTSSVNYAKEVRRKEVPPVGEPLRRPSVSQLIPNGNRRAAVDPATTPVRRVSTELNNHPSFGVNDCRREVPADAVLRAVYQMNENVNNIQRQVYQNCWPD
ncbi:hypothetical protein OUZ56_012316 [Daphnia magna]|uniref:Uncharacterized protein n=1 Tax=Daphnia magna TaxID=35525 RepID=A0ABQ9Z2N3_9CRUS|nr:hypothetical protein OUZ56_012316 [Daphnia magna]